MQQIVFQKSQFCKPLDKSMNVWPIKTYFDGTDLFFFLTSNKERRKETQGFRDFYRSLPAQVSLSASPILLLGSTVCLFSPGVRPCLTVCATSPFYSSRLTTSFRSYLFHSPTSFTSSFSPTLPAAVVLSVSHLSLPAETISAVASQLFGFWN